MNTYKTSKTVFNKQLKSAHRASENSRRAGMAVQARAGCKLQAALINIPVKKSVEIVIVKQRRKYL
jgi:hypothetical protein